MRELTLDEIWDYTKRMWKWVAFQKEVLKDERDVTTLKAVWLREIAPEFVNIKAGCFFCDVGENGCCDCTECPGVAVDAAFTCVGTDNPHNYSDKSGAFYREILRLDAIRTAAPAAPAEHVWKHGDVFKRCSGAIMICIADVKAGLHIFCVGPTGYCYGVKDAGHDRELQSLLGSATFLFNIKDKL